MAKDFFKISKGVSLQGRDTEPVNPADGDIYFDTTLDTYRARRAGVWQDLLGAAGDANSLTESLINQLNNSLYEAVTPNIFSIEEETLVDGSATGSYSLATKTFEMTSAQTMVSVQHLDPTFLADPTALGEVTLTVFWDLANLDTAATYEVSRNGGNEWQAVTMERIDSTETYTGTHKFAEEATDQTIIDQPNTDIVKSLDGSTNGAVGQQFTLSSTTALRSVDLYVTQNGIAAGNIFVGLVADDGTLPSTDPADVLAETHAIAVDSLSAGLNVINLPETVLAAGTYHIVIRTDQAYKTQFSANAGADKLDLHANTTGGGLEQLNTVSGTWSDDGDDSLKYTLKGIALDLRVRITASATSALQGYGIFYDLQSTGIISGTKLQKRFTFDTTTDPNTFTLDWLPDSDLLEVYLTNTGQVFKAGEGSFNVDGRNIVFPAGSFDNGGVSDVFTLIFQQLGGSSFDNSDQNAALMAANHLGSTDGTIDKSAVGRGIFLRRPDGTLREVALDDDDNLVIFSV